MSPVTEGPTGALPGALRWDGCGARSPRVCGQGGVSQEGKHPHVGLWALPALRIQRGSSFVWGSSPLHGLAYQLITGLFQTLEFFPLILAII